MKKLNISLVFLLLIAVGACDIVEAPYQKKDNIIIVDSASRNVLIEDFTGFRCGNCPEATEKAEQIAELYPGKVFTIGVHAGPLAVPTPGRKYDFRTTESLELQDFYGLIATPYGMVNRMKFNDQTLLSPAAWAGYALETLALPADMKINMSANYNEATREITANIGVYFISPSKPNQYLALYILEDSVVQYQQDDRAFPSVHIENFVHNNVLRGSFSGTWGNQISESTVSPGNTKDIQLKYTISPSKDWVPANLSLIAIVHNNDTKEILQVEKIKL